MPYEKGVTTVICNETGALLNVHCIPMSTGGGNLTLGLTAPDANGDEYGTYVDLEEISRPSMIQHSGINEMEASGSISFHPKGSTPKGKKRFTDSGPIAQPNQYDKQLNDLYAKEAREEKRTKQQARRRASPGEIGSSMLTPARGTPGR